jgi:hypothetical protein
MHAGEGVSASPCSLGLAGDGDELDALRDVEREFGITLDYNDAANWHRVGDVYDALLNAFGSEPIGCWRRFARAISQQTGVDPAQLGRESELFGPGTPVLAALADVGRWLIGALPRSTV